jgi:hypothetical protein
VGDAGGSVAGGLEGGVSGSVALEGGTMAMEFPAVQLHGNFLPWPEGVDLVAKHGCVEGGSGQFVLAAEGGEVILQWRARGGRGARFGE